MKRLGDDGPIPEMIDGVKIPDELRDKEVTDSQKKVFEEFGIPAERHEEMVKRSLQAQALAYETLNALASLYELVDDKPLENREAAESYMQIMSAAMENNDLVVTMINICVATQVDIQKQNRDGNND